MSKYGFCFAWLSSKSIDTRHLKVGTVKYSKEYLWLDLGYYTYNHKMIEQFKGGRDLRRSSKSNLLLKAVNSDDSNAYLHVSTNHRDREQLCANKCVYSFYKPKWCHNVCLILGFLVRKSPQISLKISNFYITLRMLS